MKKKPQSQEKKLDALARTMRRANESDHPDRDQAAIDAHHELHQPEHSKGRPLRDHGASNAGNDGGA